jgi:error-prone DNA polymerase
MANTAEYVELHCWSNFTFLQGASHPEELIERAGELGMQAIALTDRDGLYGAVRFSGAARRAGIDAIVGSELTFEDGTRVVVLVEDERGYANCCELISIAQLRGSKSDARLRMEDFGGRTDGIIALAQTTDPERARAFRTFFGERFYLELQHHLTLEDTLRNERIVELARELQAPYVATNGVVYARREDAVLADVLTCVKETIALEQGRAQHLLRPNAEYYLGCLSGSGRCDAGDCQALPFPARTDRGAIPAFPRSGRVHAPKLFT